MASCQWCLKNDTKLFRCGSCKAQSYCSKECQIKHWKSGHKEECKKYLDNLANAISSFPSDQPAEEFKAFTRVFKVWRERVTSVLPFLLVMKLSAEYCFTVQSPSKLVHITLSFNANSHSFKVLNFLPVDLNVMSSLPPGNFRESLGIIRQRFETHIQRHPSKALNFAMVLCNDVSACMPVLMNEEMLKNKDLGVQYSDKNIVKFMEEGAGRREMKFKGGELAIVQHKVKQQVSKLQVGSSNFTLWLVHALHMFTEQPLYMTHYIKVEFEFGQQLGQVGEILRYSTVSIAKMKKWLKKKKIPITPELQIKMDVTNYHDDRNNILVPIFFTTPSSNNTVSNFVYVEPKLYPKDNLEICCMKQESDRMAADKFRWIQSQVKKE
eukprot:CAMPEP_0194157676 /NCGR_PEP_ID=MMETSP0152-20130528/72882_1 /TAXON_ID=1049557 /ORGANISM="Thalassiothrix antarctica, Strain L6-D1" /LENGTH=380 /DNA_ID=CAMNT_0038866255 /DNA_START=77 /DNA_END=1219 /DNA_ORIENTATION=+